MAESAREGGIYERAQEIRTSPAEFVKGWIDAIGLASHEEDEWRESADHASKLYRAKKENRPAFNILHSNVETIVPALYNSTPVPDCRSRYGDRDDVAESAARLIERALSYDLDGEDFDAVAVGMTTHMEVVGRGVARVRWKPIIHKDADGGEEVVFDEAPAVLWPWRDFRRGPGAMWEDVPWIAYRHRMTKDEVQALIVEGFKVQIPEGAQLTPEQEAKLLETMNDALARISFDVTSKDSADEKANNSPSIFKRAEVWEILDKDTRTQVFIAPSFGESPLAVLPDSLGLIGFFDTPRPLQALKDVDGLTPIVPYDLYKQQAEELDRVSKRILKLIDQLKFRGFFAGEVPGFEKLQTLEDGEFVSLDVALAVLAQMTGGLDNAIWMVPIDRLITVLQQLLLQREQIKQAIYEITGIADILRGSTNPNETARAQSIKAQWGSLRIQRAQAEVQRYCRDLFRIKAEVICAKFSQKTLEMINGETVPPEVMKVLKSDYMRRCKVDIETDSTIQADQERARQNMSEFLGMSAQFMQIAIPAAQQLPMLSPALIEIYMAAASKLKLGKKAEEALAMVAQQIQQQAAEGAKKAEEMAAENEAKAKEAEALQKRGAEANVAKIEAETADKQAGAMKAGAEAQQTAVETQRLAATPVVQPAEYGSYGAWGTPQQ